MGIEIRQQGEPELYARAGAAIGAAQKAEKEQQIAFQREQALLEIQERRRQEQAAKDWELQKMMLNSQQDFAHEQRLKQADLEAVASAREWEVKKMKIRSQLDFEQKEKERLKTIQSITNQITTLEKFKDQLDPRQYTEKSFELQTALDNAKIGGGVKSFKLPTREKQEKDIFTPYNIQKGLGVIATGAPTSPLGIPLATLTTRKDYETFATQEWGPNWKTLVPEAERMINQKFGVPVVKPGTKELDENTAAQYILAAGGNVEQARKNLIAAGYKVD